MKPVYEDVGLELTGDRILIRPPKKEEKTAGGIVLVANTLEREERAATTGVLIAVGPEAMAHKNMKGVVIGDNLFYARYAGDNVPFTKNGVTYKVMNAADVVGKLQEIPDDPFRPAKTPKELGQINETLPA
jgi:co-chaperonin GroES (HSP10)